MTGKFGVEVLETRDTPTTFTGPLGGTVTAESSFQNGGRWCSRWWWSGRAAFTATSCRNG
jgi:hypothetical protein